MMTGIVALATCLAYPALFDDDQLLREALHARGVTVRAYPWNDPSLEWSSVDLCVLRSTWDYHHQRDSFLRWAEDVARRTQLWNPVAVLSWNSHKRYLQDLANAGVSVVPTVYFSQRERVDLAALLKERGWERAVIKPAVSASSEGALLVSTESMDEAQIHLDYLSRAGDVMVQPYVDSVRTEGERSLVAIDGALTHAVRRGDVFGQSHKSEEVYSPAADEVALAQGALHCVSTPILYARVDMVRDDAGVIRLLELELVEPSLMLQLYPPAADRFANAIIDKFSL